MTDFSYNVLRLEHSDQSKLQGALEHFNKEDLLAYFLPEPDYENTNAAEVIYKSKIDPELEEMVRLQWNEDYKSVARKHFPDWWLWRNINWGTKWDIHGPYYPNHNPPKIENGWIEIGFDTAGSPPIQAYAAAAERHGFKISAYYCDLSACYCGEYHLRDKDSSYYVDYAVGGVESTPKHLDEMFGIREWLDKCERDERDEREFDE
jgi:hypothetical protein